MSKKTTPPVIHLKKSYFNSEVSATQTPLNKITGNLNIQKMEYSKTNNENQYLGHLGMSLKGLNIDTQEQLFEVETVFEILINLEGFNEEELDQFFRINLSSFVFPYIRTEINRLVLESGYPRIDIPFIDFAGVYKKESA